MSAPAVFLVDKEGTVVHEGDTVLVDSPDYPVLIDGVVAKSSTPDANLCHRAGHVLVRVKPYGPQGGECKVSLRPDEVQLLTRAEPTPLESADELVGYAAMAAAAMAGQPVPY